MMCRVLVAVALAVAATAPPARAVVSTGSPAALLVFPLIQVDETAGLDSLIQVANTDDAEVGVRCLYEAPADGPAFTPFTIRLAADQPVAWRAGAGLAAVPGDGGGVPPLGAGPFTGILRCLTVDAEGIPTDRDVLVGSATLARSSTADVRLDSALYNASAFAAVPGASNGDDQLVLGGSGAEYSACPASLLLQTFFDGAVVELGPGPLRRAVSTTLALVTCAQTPQGNASANIAFRVTNEFGLTVTSGRSVTEQLVIPLSTIDTTDPIRSIFHVAFQGTLTGTIAMTPSAGVLGVALQAHADPDDATDAYRAAVSPRLIGERFDPDVVDLAVPTPTPPTPCLGDCNDDGSVAINELITGVTIALGSRALSECPAFDGDASDSVTINELIAAVNNALGNCP